MLCLHLGIHYSYYFRMKKHNMFVSLHSWMQITLKGIAVIQTKVNVNIYHRIRHQAQILLSLPLWVRFENWRYPWIIESSRLFGSSSIQKQPAASYAANGKRAECHYLHYYSYICMLCLTWTLITRSARPSRTAAELSGDWLFHFLSIDICSVIFV